MIDGNIVHIADEHHRVVLLHGEDDHDVASVAGGLGVAGPLPLLAVGVLAELNIGGRSGERVEVLIVELLELVGVVAAVALEDVVGAEALAGNGRLDLTPLDGLDEHRGQRRLAGARRALHDDGHLVVLPREPQHIVGHALLGAQPVDEVVADVDVALLGVDKLLDAVSGKASLVVRVVVDVQLLGVLLIRQRRYDHAAEAVRTNEVVVDLGHADASAEVHILPVVVAVRDVLREGLGERGVPLDLLLGQLKKLLRPRVHVGKAEVKNDSARRVVGLLGHDLAPAAKQRVPNGLVLLADDLLSLGVGVADDHALDVAGAADLVQLLSRRDRRLARVQLLRLTEHTRDRGHEVRHVRVGGPHHVLAVTVLADEGLADELRHLGVVHAAQVARDAAQDVVVQVVSVEVCGDLEEGLVLVVLPPVLVVVDLVALDDDGNMAVLAAAEEHEVVVDLEQREDRELAVVLRLVADLELVLGLPLLDLLVVEEAVLRRRKVLVVVVGRGAVELGHALERVHKITVDVQARERPRDGAEQVRVLGVGRVIGAVADRVAVAASRQHLKGAGLPLAAKDLSLGDLAGDEGRVLDGDLELGGELVNERRVLLEVAGSLLRGTRALLGHGHGYVGM